MPSLTELETYYATLVAETDEAREALDTARIAYSAASALSAAALVSLESRRHTSGNPSIPPSQKEVSAQSLQHQRKRHPRSVA